MIHSQDRSGWFGCSDTKFIMMDNWQSKTFSKFWSIKTGEIGTSFAGSKYTRAGNMFEHPLLLAVDPEMVLDGQIIHDKYLLRANYDGYKDGIIREAKTHKSDHAYEIPTEHWQQVQVEMFVYQEKQKQWFLPPFEGLEIISYALYPDEYWLEPDEIVIDESRIIRHQVKYDKHWIKSEYLPRLKICARALRRGKYPIL